MMRIMSPDTLVLLFCRIHGKEKSKPVLFTYAGRLVARKAQSQNPVKVLFDLLDYKESPNEALASLYEWRPAGGRKLDVLDLPDESSAPRKGQGWQTDARKRQAIDTHAMKRVRFHYESMDYVLKDTSKVSPFDFEARRNGDTLRIEVKGLTGHLGPIVVTAGEVLSARNPDIRTDLVVVYEIEVLETELGVFEGRGGTVHVLEGWRPEEDRLKPLQYQYQLP